MADAYRTLHVQGVAHSIEAWRDGRLVGGLYGVSLGDIFFGESMFADAPDASKCAFVVLVRHLRRVGVELVDSQVRTEHVARFGGKDWTRARYLRRLAALVDRPTRLGPWTVTSEDLDEPLPTP